MVHITFAPPQGPGFRGNLEGGPAGWSPLFPDLAHKISLQWSTIQVISQACPGSFETSGLAMSISRDLGCVIVPSHSSMVASEPSRPGRASTLGRGHLPSSVPLLAYLHGTTTQVAVQDWTLMSRTEDFTLRDSLKGPRAGTCLVELSWQNMLRSLNAVTS